MATLVMVVGQSGTGKSTSLRNFKRDEVAVVNVSAKPLPFRNELKVFSSDDYKAITKAIVKAPQQSIVIDDATYLMTDEFMRTATISGYQKFTDMALNFFNLVKTCAALPADKVVYLMGHLDTDQNGNEKFKTIGKMLDEKVTLEGMFTVVLKTVVADGKYSFSTRNNGHDTVKTPMGMFDTPLIDNDLRMVDQTIRRYWNLAGQDKEESNAEA